ncbi:MAG: hypothetical protein LV471_07280 [Nitrosomonas sp.]|nr:hypothetical protein [Nitrosomonas sp.]
MPIKKLHSILSKTLLLLLVCMPLPGWPVALLTESFELHIPWINYQNQTYTAVLKAEAGNTQAFQLLTATGRESVDQQNMPASAGNDFNVHMPLVSYRGELYSATMNSDGNGHFRLTDAQPAHLARMVVEQFSPLRTRKPGLLDKSAAVTPSRFWPE